MPVPNRIIVDLEVCYAKNEAKYTIDERGQEVVFYLNDNSSIERDLYGSVIKKSDSFNTFTLYAYPFITNPTRKEMEKAGIREDAELLMYTAELDWDVLNVDYKILNSILSYVEISGEHYNIKEVGTTSSHANESLYTTFSLNKK